MKVELFYSPGCSQCAAAQASLKAAAQQAIAGLEWCELNVLEELEYAVELGVLTLPAIAVDGELLFSSMPTPQQLCEALTGRMTKKA
jgi:predicted thioredoxin/glutaredoxin